MYYYRRILNLWSFNTGFFFNAGGVLSRFDCIEFFKMKLSFFQQGVSKNSEIQKDNKINMRIRYVVKLFKVKAGIINLNKIM